MSTRKYTTNLMLENLLYVIPPAAGNTYTLLHRVVNPTVPVVERDCGTYLGLPVDRRVLTQGDMWKWVISAPGYGILYPTTTGDVLAATGNAYQATKPFQYFIRHPGYCASQGGICARCALANLRMSTGTVYPPEDFEVITDHILAAGVFTLRCSLGQVREFFTPSEYALLTWLSDTYTGGLLGLSAIEKLPLPVKQSLYHSVIPANLLAQVTQETLQNPQVPEDYADLFTRITNPLEQALFCILMYGMFGRDADNNPPEVFAEAEPYVYS